MNFENSFIKCNINYLDNFKNIKISGNIININLFDSVLIIAPNTIDRMVNYSGSGLPFPNSEIAFDNTKNKYLIDNTGFFNIIFTYPNSYYSEDFNNKIISSLYFIFKYKDSDNVEIIRLQLKDICLLKTLINRETRIGPEFYAAKEYLLIPDTAENIMRQYKKIKFEYNIA